MQNEHSVCTDNPKLNPSNPGFCPHTNPGLRVWKRVAFPSAAMIAVYPRQVWRSWIHAPLINLCQLCPAPTRKDAKLSITQPWITRLSSNSVVSLNAWHSKCFKRSRSRGQRSRSRPEITCAKFAKLLIIQPWIVQFNSNFVQTLITRRLMYHELSRSTGQRSRSQRDMTSQHQKRYTSGTDKLSNVKSQSRARTHNTCSLFKVIMSNIELAITPPRLARLCSNLLQSFITSHANV